MLIPYLTVADPEKAIEIYKKALDATLVFVMDAPDGGIMHAELQVSGQQLMLSGEWPGFATAPKARSPVNFMLYVDDAVEAQRKAVDAGMTKSSEPETMFWGECNARVTDGQGYEWTFAHKVEDVEPEEMAKRAAAFAESMTAPSSP